MRGWWLAMVVVAGLMGAAAAAMMSVALNVATGGSARWFPGMDRHPLWWTLGGTAGVAGAGLLAWWAQRRYDEGLAELVPAVQRPEPWVVDRPAEVSQVVAALKRKSGGTVGITTAVQGAGGFGKTTVAKVVRADRRVLRRFRGRVHWVTLGRDAGKEVLPGLVNGLIAQLDPDRAVTFTDARQATDHLAAILAKGPRRLLILDDVWTGQQLAAFLATGRCARLVTTRIPSLATGTAVPVRVDQMTGKQARALLLNGLPPLSPALTEGLLEETGRWPLLLRLVNKILADQAALDPSITVAAEGLLGALRSRGALQVDELTGAAGRRLDVSDPDQRNQAVRATIEASTSLLTPGERARLAELAVFAEDETIPLPLISSLWGATSGAGALAARALVARLADLALLTLVPSASGAVTMHDVIGDYLRDQIGTERLAQLHAILLDTVAGGLPRAHTGAAGEGEVTAWWELPPQARYLTEHLIEHLLGAGRPGRAAELAMDLRWVGMRLDRAGPAGPYADLALVGTPETERLRRVLGQAAHLLAPTDPPYSLTDILYSRVSHDPDWGPHAQALSASRKLPALSSKWPPPDLPSHALRRTLAGHIGWVMAIAIAPDGTWLATAGYDETVRVWDAATGQCRATLTGHTDRVTAVAIAPDGTWLATASDDGTAGVWDAVTGENRATLTGHTGRVTAVAIAPDGTWLATTGNKERTARVWDAATGQCRAVLTGHAGRVITVAIAPDGTWLATAGDGMPLIWDAATGRRRAALAGHTGTVWAVAVAPDSAWLATASDDGTARIWDAATGQCRAVLTGHTDRVTAVTDWVTAVAIAPDSAWLATASYDGTARIWDAATGQCRAVLTGHTGRVTAVAIALDGTWLATASDDGTVRVWDAVTGENRATLTGHTGSVTAVAIASDSTWLATASYDETARVWDAATRQLDAVPVKQFHHVRAVAIAPDGTWLASGDDDGTARIWDTATGQCRATLTGHTRAVNTVAIAPDGTWLASGSTDQTVRIWDTASAQERATLTGHDGQVTAVAIAPDGTWLASGSTDQTARIWDTTTRQLRKVIGGTKDVTAVAVAPDGTWLATARGKTVRVWDTSTGRLRRALTGYGAEVTAVAVAPDGTRLATGSTDHNVRIWDTSTGQLRKALIGHTKDVTGVAVTPDGTWLATVSWDKTVRIWDISTGGVSAVMRTDSMLSDCAWSPSGHLLAVVSDAGLYLFAFNS